MIKTPENGSVELLSTSSGNYVTEISMNIRKKWHAGWQRIHSASPNSMRGGSGWSTKLHTHWE